MRIKICEDKRVLGTRAAERAAELMRSAIEEKGNARIIAATGASQFDFLAGLTAIGDLDWSKVTMFHLDEYVGLPETHPASFRRYLRERLISKVNMGACHFLNPEDNPAAECNRMGKILSETRVDVAFVGIGENGHLAFNDPPADFETEEPYIIVTLDDPCRRQQLGEGWFASLSEVPTRAISMTVRQILKAKEILVVVPDARKAQAVRSCFEGEITPMAPASILRKHANTTVFLDKLS